MDSCAYCLCHTILAARASSSPPQQCQPMRCAQYAGAPHKIDEGAALWFGAGCEKGNIANVANKRGSSWGTMVNTTEGCTA